MTTGQKFKLICYHFVLLRFLGLKRMHAHHVSTEKQHFTDQFADIS